MRSCQKFLMLVLTLAVILSLASCKRSSYELNDSHADVFCRTLVDLVIADEKEKTLQMVSGICTKDEFEDFWFNFRTSTVDATGADIHMTDFLFFTENKVDYFKGQYFVEFDNGSCMNLSLTFDANNTLYNILFRDITDFYPGARKTADVLNIVLGVYSLLTLGFCIWMIVDCVRRRIRKKALWIIAILLGVSFTVLTGMTGISFAFMIGLLLQRSGAAINFAYLAISTKVIIPVGAIVYFCLRKRLTIVPPPVPTQPAVSFDTTVEPPSGDLACAAPDDPA